MHASTTHTLGRAEAVSSGSGAARSQPDQLGFQRARVGQNIGLQFAELQLQKEALHSRCHGRISSLLAAPVDLFQHPRGLFEPIPGNQTVSPLRSHPE